MGEVHGGCLCGATRYTLKAAPSGVILCHCTHCQKSSGSAFSTNLLVPDADIAFEGAPAAVYHDKGESGGALDRHFCARCGASLGSVSAGIPGHFVLKAGSLDDHSSLGSAAVQIWTRSKQPWVKFAAEPPSHEKGFPG
jgi:hypothetical protein